MNRYGEIEENVKINVYYMHRVRFKPCTSMLTILSHNILLTTYSYMYIYSRKLTHAQLICINTIVRKSMMLAMWRAILSLTYSCTTSVHEYYS